MKEKKTWILIVMSVLFMAVICSAACYYEMYVVREFKDSACKLVTPIEGGGTLGSAEQYTWTYKQETGCKPNSGLKRDCTVSTRKPNGDIRVNEKIFKKYYVNYCSSDPSMVSNGDGEGEVVERISPFGLATTGDCRE